MRFATGRYNQLQPFEKATLVFNPMSFPHCYVPNANLRPLCDELANTPIDQWLNVVSKTEKVQPNLNLDNFLARVELQMTLRRKGSF